VATVGGSSGIHSSSVAVNHSGGVSRELNLQPFPEAAAVVVQNGAGIAKGFQDWIRSKHSGF
jgi:hypothetical protein